MGEHQSGSKQPDGGAHLVPPGWKLVPKQLTPEMRRAAKLAMHKYVESLPDEAKARMPIKNGRLHIPTNLKFDLRYQATIAASPECPCVKNSPKEPDLPPLREPTESASHVLAVSCLGVMTTIILLLALLGAKQVSKTAVSSAPTATGPKQADRTYPPLPSPTELGPSISD